MGKPIRATTADELCSHPVIQSRLSCDHVQRIAWKDAEKAYRDLSGFSIHIAEEADGWHVDYEPKDEGAHGGGPHYVIHPVTGKILEKRYEQ